jgi:hypothetical protein
MEQKSRLHKIADNNKNVRGENGLTPYMEAKPATDTTRYAPVNQTLDPDVKVVFNAALNAINQPSVAVDNLLNLSMLELRDAPISAAGSLDALHQTVRHLNKLIDSSMLRTSPARYTTVGVVSVLTAHINEVEALVTELNLHYEIIKSLDSKLAAVMGDDTINRRGVVGALNDILGNN